MTAPIAGDQARAAVLVQVPIAAAFRIFTEELDAWWRDGPRYRIAGRARGTIALEPGLGGRVFETYQVDGETRTFVSGEIVAWEPPVRLAFTWRLSNFGPGEQTAVEVTFAPQSKGTLVTVTHRGWAAIRADHPARHGQPVDAFLGGLGRWWGDQLTALRQRGDHREA